jgi:hypothetical protein
VAERLAAIDRKMNGGGGDDDDDGDGAIGSDSPHRDRPGRDDDKGDEDERGSADGGARDGNDDDDADDDAISVRSRSSTTSESALAASRVSSTGSLSSLRRLASLSAPKVLKQPQASTSSGLIVTADAPSAAAFASSGGGGMGLGMGGLLGSALVGKSMAGGGASSRPESGGGSVAGRSQMSPRAGGGGSGGAPPMLQRNKSISVSAAALEVIANSTGMSSPPSSSSSRHARAAAASHSSAADATAAAATYMVLNGVSKAMPGRRQATSLGADDEGAADAVDTHTRVACAISGTRIGWEIEPIVSIGSRIDHEWRSLLGVGQSAIFYFLILLQHVWVLLLTLVVCVPSLPYLLSGRPQRRWSPPSCSRCRRRWPTSADRTRSPSARSSCD